ncbi:peptidylprolyl isomerase [Flavobacteriaceae bacterium]|jgi:peptidyl-prolyl cis-trans isomerase A (cyclophilin A)|nr:peptidylprolyl isomerase [Flavobacteriaceae bacterium]MDB4182975.1 peptidylprolyl isomerase [Flavobacteriaceae bacterium]MDG1394237.1 peptidylprolyl isomerase [Flavobacteriaceae bacterium]
MRILIILFLGSTLFSCEDKKTKVNKIVPKKSTSTPLTKDVNPEKKESDFILNDKNVMEFFLAYDKKHLESTVRITTDFGLIDIRLFEATKFHRSNFIYLTKKKYFDQTQFYRVIPNFVIQGGNSDDRPTLRKRQKIGKYLLPNDHDKGFKHNRGMVSMPSSSIENPYKLASPFEFFIVQQQGGAHHLDGDYTVFGTVINGMDVVDKIAAVPTDSSDWPLQNVFIQKVEILE